LELDSADRAAEIAHHYLRSRSPDCRGTAFSYLIRAGDLEFSSFALERAVDHFQAALDCASQHAAGRPGAIVPAAAVATAHGRLGYAQYRSARVARSTGHLSQAARNLARGAEILIEHDEKSALGTLIRATEDAWIHIDRPALCRRILAHLNATDVVMLSEFPIGSDARLVRRARRFNYRAIKRARSAGDATGELDAWCRLIRLERHSLRLNAALRIARRVRDRIGDGPRRLQERPPWALDYDTELLAVRYPAVDGRLDLAESRARRFARSASEHGWNRVAASAHLVLGVILRAQGRYDEALASGRRAAKLAPGDMRVVLLEMSCRVALGHSGRASTLLDRFRTQTRTLDSWPSYPDGVVELAALFSMTGDSAWRDAAAEVDREAPPSARHAWNVQCATIGEALIAATAGERSSALRLLSALRRCPRTMDESLVISIDRLRGLLCDAIGRRRTAVRHFRRAIQFAAEMYPGEHAWACLNLCESLLASRRGVSTTRALRILDRASERAAGSGMQLLLERTERVRAACGGDASSRRSTPES
jgi:tetratricopeptide (TPR) repeat protein